MPRELTTTQRFGLTNPFPWPSDGGMHWMRQFPGGFLAGALLAAYLLAVTLAMSPELHHWLHGDSDAPNHQCAAVQIIGGQIDLPAAPPAEANRPPVISKIVCWLDAASIRSRLPLASPGERAPPQA